MKRHIGRFRQLFMCTLFVLIGLNLTAQLNVDSLSHVDYQLLHGANLNDVWGYVDELGNEYAIVGTSKGTSIVNITDGNNPQEIFWMAGTESIWRDPCVSGDYAYVTTEAEDGLLIIDLSPLPQSTNLSTTLYTGPSSNPWQSAHTCYTSPNGYAYIFGSNRGNGGVIMLDIHTDPMNPIEVGTYDPFYVHDGFERNDTLYIGHIYDGFFSLVDVTDKSNPILLGTKTTPNSFTHNIWPSTDGQVVYTTDEISGAYITAYNIQNPSNIVELDRVQSSANSIVIPHNVHVLGGYLVTSYYSDGIIIHDATYPYNLIQVGNFDTYLGQTPGFDGCWGVYPFFPSGKTVAADITKGLFILDVNYQKGCYLEGVVTDALSGAALSNVSVQLSSAVMLEKTNQQGFYATGTANSGVYTVDFTKAGYYPMTLTVSLINGQLNTINVPLIPITPFFTNVTVLEYGTNAPISDANIRFSHPIIEHEGMTNGLGIEEFTMFYQENYRLTVGKWGYQTFCVDTVVTAFNNDLTIYLTPGYYDDFEFDFGWSVSGTATSGMWERGVPNPTTNVVSSQDAQWDCGKKAFVTGNDVGLNPDHDDVDGGFTQLLSPQMDFSSYSTPYINFATSFFCYHGPGNFDDTLKVYLSNGTNSVLIYQPTTPEGNPMSFEYTSIPLSGLLPFTNTMQVQLVISDLNPNVNITEAGFDHFSITNQPIANVVEEHEEEWTLYPNPTATSLKLRGTHVIGSFTILDLTGKQCIQGNCSEKEMECSVEALEPGMYLIRFQNQVLTWVKQ
ncbi:MAG: choice-of-anchor B family protein [Crocinitomicaceae bacterium]